MIVADTAVAETVEQYALSRWLCYKLPTREHATTADMSKAHDQGDVAEQRLEELTDVRSRFNGSQWSEHVNEGLERFLTAGAAVASTYGIGAPTSADAELIRGEVEDI